MIVRILSLLLLISPAVEILQLHADASPDASWSRVQSIDLRTGTVHHAAYSPDGRLLAIPNLLTVGSISVLDVTGRNPVVPGQFRPADFSRRGDILLLQRSEAPHLCITLPPCMRGYRVAFSPTEPLLACLGNDTLRLYRTDTWRLEMKTAVAAGTTALAFNPQTGQLLTGAAGGISALDRTGPELVPLIPAAQGMEIASFIISGDGSLLLTAEFDAALVKKVMRVGRWDLAERQEIGPIVIERGMLNADPAGEACLLAATAAGDTLGVAVPRLFPEVHLYNATDRSLISRFRRTRRVVIDPAHALLLIDRRGYSLSSLRAPQFKLGRGPVGAVAVSSRGEIALLNRFRLERYQKK